MDEKNYLKDRTVCKSCYNENRKNNNKTLIQNQQTKTDEINNDNNRNVSAFENHAYVVVGPRNVGKT